MAEIVRRRSWGGVLPLGRQASISGSSLIQCASASIAPPHPGGAKCYPGAEIQGRTGPSQARVVSLSVTVALLLVLGIGRARIAKRGTTRTVVETLSIGVTAALAGVGIS